MVVGSPGPLLLQTEFVIHRKSAKQKGKPMSPERKREEDPGCDPPGEELEGDSLSSEGGRVTDSTDDEESSSTESTPAKNGAVPVEEQGTEEAENTIKKQEKIIGSEVQRRLEAEQLKVMNRISKLEHHMRELQLQRRELNIEVEMEVALLEGELRTERKEIEKEEELIRALHEKLRETEKKWQEEEEKDKLRLWDEKKKIKDLEQKIIYCQSQLEKQPESLREQLRKHIQEMKEAMEGAVKSFEDLEFQQLERESGREEEREASYRQIVEDISKHQNELNRRKDKILRLEEQVRGAEEQAQVERSQLSEENTRIFKSLNQEKERLQSLNSLCRKDPGQNENPTRKALQRTNSLPKRRTSAPFVRPTDRPLSLHGNTCLESAGLALHFAVSSNNAGGQIALAISPNLQITQARLSQGEDRIQSRGFGLEKMQNEIPTLQLSYGPFPKIAEIERQLREAIAEKERLLKAREEKRAAKEMTRCLETNQTQVKEVETESAPTTVQTAQPDSAEEPVPPAPCSPPPFDLRSHLEASGHSVETCLHVRVSSTCCRGYLVKMGGRIKTWRKRWFVFDRQKRRLAYYSDKGEQKLKGVIYFQAIEEVYYDHLRSAFKSPHPKLTFCLKTFERLFCMVAPTPEAMRIWIDVMVTAAEENSRY